MNAMVSDNDVTMRKTQQGGTGRYILRWAWSGQPSQSGWCKLRWKQERNTMQWPKGRVFQGEKRKQLPQEDERSSCSKSKWASGRLATVRWAEEWWWEARSESRARTGIGRILALHLRVPQAPQHPWLEARGPRSWTGKDEFSSLLIWMKFSISFDHECRQGRKNKTHRSSWSTCDSHS